ncbi:MAG TPA: hypothetical protein DEW39_06005 [Brevibacterium sp.]|uniref:Uncharacterized protein n=1 Tax=Brevibacterium antiquum CNRZ 918 TaxID=1255637 RepID=A0A2H1K4F3_9MICO|nr:hypothetical protein BANT918_02145 [Brevibacterium antiquum CNRZ 918]HCG55696.1 hypothetical protein [Brevibacterium sp.]
MAPAHAIDGPDAHDHATKQLAPELTIDGPQQDGYSSSYTIHTEDLDVAKPTFSNPDLTTFCRLNDLDLTCIGQHLTCTVGDDFPGSTGVYAGDLAVASWFGTLNGSVE